MDLLAIKEIIRVWAPIISIIFGGYNTYDYFIAFKSDAASPLLMKQRELEEAKKQTKALEVKLSELEEFKKTNEAKQKEVMSLAQNLGETKVALSEDVQMPDFMKLMVSEAKRVGLTVLSITPAKRIEKEFYYEYPVEVKFRGIFAQLFSFMSRLSSLQRIVHVDKFEVRPVTKASARFVELEGSIRVKTFSYVGSKADQLFQESK
ncbi:MAG: type 4a pilus biogenesis protein PilO [Bdellovibrionales bacterium]|nr:type 4a pilus biogenesis protein PilO [Bdellovibrionales bacterium]